MGSDDTYLDTPGALNVLAFHSMFQVFCRPKHKLLSLAGYRWSGSVVVASGWLVVDRRWLFQSLGWSFSRMFSKLYFLVTCGGRLPLLSGLELYQELVVRRMLETKEGGIVMLAMVSFAIQVALWHSDMKYCRAAVPHVSGDVKCVGLLKQRLWR